ncbi:MAG: type II toxin-antitoxin system RelE/ParE family toxin [Planctomycetes bacterium]|nr:type II toxin-antitoxin system RelE/ParE family toxin [Planctomycetota bacterium]
MGTAGQVESDEEGEEPLKPIFWIGSSLDDLREFPDDVKSVMGYALYQAQQGEKHVDAKPLKGFGGAGVLEIFEDHVGNAYRGVYTVRFAGAVYVLDAFQKKSKSGIRTPPRDIARIKSRLKAAADHHKQWRLAQRQIKDEP